MSDLTPRQTEILRLIQTCISETGMPPTRAEIARELGFRSANAAEEHLRALARKGVIALVPGTSRGIQVKDTMREQFGLPLIGRVAAGRPILAEENIEAHYKIDPAIFQPRPHYLLKVGCWRFISVIPRIVSAPSMKICCWPIATFRLKRERIHEVRQCHPACSFRGSGHFRPGPRTSWI